MTSPSSFRQAGVGAADVAVEAVEAVSCGRLALWLGLLRAMGLRQELERLLPTDAVVSHGAVLEALILNRLLAPRPLYAIEDWARDVGLATLTGLDPDRLNDDRLGRALDALAPRIQDVQAAITTRVVATFRLDATDAHYDTTTAWFEGAYDDSDLAAHGHSKDGRGDHKQVVIGLVTAADGEVPLAHTVHRGNTGDVTTVPAALHALRAALPTDPIVVRGDCAMWSQANMDAVAAARGVVLGPLAMSATVAAWVCATTPGVDVTVQLARQRTPVAYRACVAGRFAVNGVADAGARLVVYDARRAQAEAAERAAALTRYETALAALAPKLHRGRLKTATQLATHLAALAKRHGLAARYVTVTAGGDDGHLTVTWQRDAAALAAAPARDGKWPLVTNKTGLADAELCVWAVRRYKGHGRIERDQHLLKGPLQVRPFFVQSDDRIRALVAVCAWALTAWTVLERQARRALPPGPSRPARPPIARVEALLYAVAVLTFRLGDAGPLRRAATPLSPQVQSLLHGLGWSREVRAGAPRAPRGADRALARAPRGDARRAHGLLPAARGMTASRARPRSVLRTAPRSRGAGSGGLRPGGTALAHLEDATEAHRLADELRASRWREGLGRDVPGVIAAVNHDLAVIAGDARLLCEDLAGDSELRGRRWSWPSRVSAGRRSPGRPP